MELTTDSSDYLNKSAVGYMVNTLLSEPSRNEIKQLQDTFVAEFGYPVWATPVDSLHITLLDWLAPLVDYSGSKDRIFREIKPKYDKALGEILSNVDPISLTFGKIIVSQSAIVIVADKKSTQAFNDIRQKFLSKIDLLPNTKQPPNIVHSTIIRFVDEIPMKKAMSIANSLNCSFIEQVSSFQLVREARLPMLEYSVIKLYHLGTD